mmetsp:Transcript_1547/g.4136  ORF Transcript_1547/g.4136 Transcript_1547/m.4136 type:complete len:243 (+) Transcript_1547:202-930(+)
MSRPRVDASHSPLRRWKNAACASEPPYCSASALPMPSYSSISVCARLPSESTSGALITPSAASCRPSPASPYANCAMLVRSRQSMQLVRSTPACLRHPGGSPGCALPGWPAPGAPPWGGCAVVRAPAACASAAPALCREVCFARFLSACASCKTPATPTVGPLNARLSPLAGCRPLLEPEPEPEPEPPAACWRGCAGGWAGARAWCLAALVLSTNRPVASSAMWVMADISDRRPAPACLACF